MYIYMQMYSYANVLILCRYLSLDVYITKKEMLYIRLSLYIYNIYIYIYICVCVYVSGGTLI